MVQTGCYQFKKPFGICVNRTYPIWIPKLIEINLLCGISSIRIQTKKELELIQKRLKCCISFVRHTLGMTDMLMQF